MNLPPKSGYQGLPRPGRHGAVLETIWQFYKTTEGRYFVWPYIRRVKGDVDITKHFPVHGYFADRDIARHAAITQGESLIEGGFDPDRD